MKFLKEVWPTIFALAFGYQLGYANPHATIGGLAVLIILGTVVHDGFSWLNKKRTENHGKSALGSPGRS